MSDQMIVRSYRRVFRVDRRVYRVDRWALPVPGGVPLRGIGYFALALVGVLALGALPLVGGVIESLTAPLRYVVLPLAVAVLAAQAAPDGRPAHRLARSWIALRLRGRRTSAGRKIPAEGERLGWSAGLATRSDEHGPSLTAGKVTGPAHVHFTAPVRLEHGRGGWLIARPAESGEPADVVLCADARLEVRP